MEGVLVTGGLIILTSSNAVAAIRVFHGQSDPFGNVKNAVTVFWQQCIEAFEMLVRNDNYVAGILSHKERADKRCYQIIFINNVGWSHQRVRAFNFLNTKTNWADVIFGCVTFYHIYQYTIMRNATFWLIKYMYTVCMKHSDYMTEVRKHALHSWVTTDMSAVCANIETITKTTKAQGKATMLMLKANAYGCGMVEIAMLAQRMDLAFFGVAHLEDAIVLRKHGIQTPLLLFTEPTPEAIPMLQGLAVTPVVSSAIFLNELLAQRATAPVSFHIKINTGMNRYGFKVHELPAVLRVLEQHRVSPEGLMTHYSSASDNDQKTQEEFSLFRSASDLFKEAGHSFRYIHASNTPATAWFKEDVTNLVRIGLGAYGFQPSGRRSLPLLPVITWYTKLTFRTKISKGESVGYGGSWTAKRDSVIGVMPIGYSDGFRRAPYRQAYVLCESQRLPIVGNVMMNHTILDLTDAQDDVQIGSEITILGDEGAETLALETIARQQQTINEEVATSISTNIRRFPIRVPARLREM
jgi:alanine racemase